MSHKRDRSSSHESAHVSDHAADPNVGPKLDARHGFPSEHRRGLLPELYFRWRGGEITRLEAFCDIVFGFPIRRVKSGSLDGSQKTPEPRMSNRSLGST